MAPSFARTITRVPVGFALPVVILLLMFVFEAINSRFLTPSNLQNIARQSSILAVVALAQTFAILTRGIDLSVGTALGLASVVTALVAAPLGLGAGFAAGITVGLVVGAVNGSLIAYLRLPPIIVTLGMLSIARGLAFIVSGGQTVSGVPEGFATIGNESIGGVPVMAIIALTATFLSWVILSRTSMGRRIYSVGGNEVAARLSGVAVARYRFLAYLASGLLVGVAAVMAASRVNSGNPLTGSGYELQSIAAVVIGGISLRGGVGPAWGGVLGAVLIAMVANGLTLIGLSSYLQLMITGAILLLAVSVDQALHRRAG